MFRTHEDVQKFITERCYGAKVVFDTIAGGAGENTANMRRYTVMHPDKLSAGIVNVYSLPCNPELIGKAVKDTLKLLYDR